MLTLAVLNQLNIFLLSFGVLQGFLVGLFIICKKNKHSSHIFLILFLTVIGLQLTFKALSKAWLWQNVNLIYQLAYSLPYLIGPLLYLFIRSRINSVPFRSWDILHFIPFCLGLSSIFLMVVYHYNSIVIQYWEFVPWSVRHLASLFIYGILSWKLLDQQKEKDRDIVNAMKQFVIWIVLTEAIIIVTITIMIYNFPNFPDIRLFFIALTVLIYWISYKLMTIPTLLAQPIETFVLRKNENTIKYAHSGLKLEEANRIAARLQEAIQHQKIFLKEDISLETLASTLGIAKHDLSRVINEKFQKNFVDFINGWRLEEARLKLSDPKFGHYTISAIALDSGFNSVSSFNNIFKRNYQITPSKFRAQNLKEMSI